MIIFVTSQIPFMVKFVFFWHLFLGFPQLLPIFLEELNLVIIDQITLNRLIDNFDHGDLIFEIIDLSTMSKNGDVAIAGHLLRFAQLHSTDLSLMFLVKFCDEGHFGVVFSVSPLQRLSKTELLFVRKFAKFQRFKYFENRITKIFPSIQTFPVKSYMVHDVIIDH